jgi:hypothetical protein
VIIAVDDNRTAWKSVLSWSRIMEIMSKFNIKESLETIRNAISYNIGAARPTFK